MNDDASEVKRLLSPLRDRPVSVKPERLQTRRERILASLKQDVHALSVERTRRPKRRAGYAVLGLSAAACLLVGARFLAKHDAAPSITALTFVGSVGDTLAGGGPNPRHLLSGDHLEVDPGELETAAQGSAELVNGSGLGLHLGEATRVSLSGLIGREREQKNQLELRQGSVTCTVPHLIEGQRFAVSTPDARVVVHGTVFSVQVDSARSSGSETCVRVTDGVVIVQHGGSETALNAGESWGCDPSALAGRVLAEPAKPMAAEEYGADAVVDLGHAPQHAPVRGTLNDEIHLFQAALAAERLGQKGKAELDLNRLLAKYPSSPLAPEARRALTRIAGGTSGK